MSLSRTLSRLDLNLLTTALLIAAIGCLLVYSATYFGPEAPLFRKQVIWTLIGIILMILFIAVDYHVLMEIAPFPRRTAGWLALPQAVSERTDRDLPESGPRSARRRIPGHAGQDRHRLRRHHREGISARHAGQSRIPPRPPHRLHLLRPRRRVGLRRRQRGAHALSVFH